MAKKQKSLGQFAIDNARELAQKGIKPRLKFNGEFVECPCDKACEMYICGCDCHKSAGDTAALNVAVKGESNGET